MTPFARHFLCFRCTSLVTKHPLPKTGCDGHGAANDRSTEHQLCKIDWRGVGKLGVPISR